MVIMAVQLKDNSVLVELSTRWFESEHFHFFAMFIQLPFLE